MMIKKLGYWTLLLTSASALLQDAMGATLEKDFSNPPVSVRPYVWWHWMGPNISEDGITKDLEAMKDAGIGGATIFHITSAVTVGAKPTDNCPWPEITYRSPKWWALMKHAASEANRLGLELGMHNCVGYATTGGPWITPERGMQRLVRKMEKVQGGKQVTVDLPIDASNLVDLGVFAVPAEGIIPLDKIIDLSAKMDAKGHLVWEAPPGAWNIYRLGSAFTGHQPSPMPDDMLNKAFEVDKMSVEQNRYHWQQVLEPLKQNLGSLVGKSFRHILIDSYEAGDQNWTATFREEFKRLKGYDPLPWLMTMNSLVTDGRKEEARIVADADRSARFEWDYLDVTKTLFGEGFRAGAEAIRKAGLTFQWEPYSGPFNMIASSALADTPMGEFWTGGQGGIDSTIAAAGRAAGRRVIGAESFTGMPPLSRWTETPAFLKASGDGTYACGVNRLVLHHWVHQPFDEKYKPGIGMGWWGTHFSRNQTWFEPGKAYFAYLGRAQALLQRGEGVADYLALDHAPAGADAVATAALLNGDLRVEDGVIVLPSGRRYPFLQLPPGEVMLPEAARALKKLVAAGGVIVGQKPVRSPSMSGYPAADAEVRKLGDEIWSNPKVLTKPVKPAPSVTTPGADIRTTARKDGETDIFFLANTSDEAREFTASLRVTGKQPELWQAEDGTSRVAAAWKTAAGRTELPLRLNAHQSIFVIFRKPAPADHAIEIVAADKAAYTARVNEAGQVVICSAGPCRGEIVFASGKRAPFAVEAVVPIPLAGAWKVAFAPGLGAPAQVDFPELRSWSENTDPNIKYFSGTATYRKELRLDALHPGQRYVLDLGTVHELASIKVNGRSLGVLWYPPFRMDVTAALKAGANLLEARVTNTWANRLIGDEQEPEDSQWTEWETFRDFGGYAMKAYPDWFVKNQPRPSPGRKCFVTYNYFNKGTPLFPAGLLGPVQLIVENEVKADGSTNPSFEEKEGDGVKGYQSRAWAGEENARWSVESPGRTGKHCVSISSASGADAAWTATVPVKPNTFYRLSGWIKTKDVRGASGALLNIQNMQEAKTAALSGSRDWTEVSTVFQSGAATEFEINCLFGGWGKSTGQVWYDDVALQQVDEPPVDTQAIVTIDTGARSMAYSPMIFGGFLEHFDHQVYGGVFEPGSPLSDKNGFRRDVVAALKELKVPVVRWPGGCYVSGYHWEAGVGKNRKPTDDMAWGVIEPNTFGTDEYVELCRLLNWDPYICNNAGNGTVEEMANWVEYCNGTTGKYAQMRKDNGSDRPLNVRLWSIGNENWGQHEIGYKPIEQWSPLVLEAAKAMKAADPRIQLTAAALPSREWTLPLLKAAGPYLSYISIHSYWLPFHSRNEMPDYLTCIMQSEGPENTVSGFVGVLEESGYGGKVKIAYDEWNLRGWHHEGFPRKTVQNYADPEVIRLIAAREKNDIASQYTMADALFSASFFNACLRHAEDVGMANIAPLVNTRGPLYVHPKGIVKRTHFHAMAMYANKLEARVGKLNIEAGSLRQGDRKISVMDGIATVDEAGHKWSIALVNRHPDKSLACTVKMKDTPLDGNYAAIVLAGDSPEAFNDIGCPDRVVPVKTKLTFTKGVVNLPPHSLTIINVTLNNNQGD